THDGAAIRTRQWRPGTRDVAAHAGVAGVVRRARPTRLAIVYDAPTDTELSGAAILSDVATLRTRIPAVLKAAAVADHGEPRIDRAAIPRAVTQREVAVVTLRTLRVARATALACLTG